MAPLKQPSTRRPGPQWDGRLYAPQTFGEGPKVGTVEWAQAQRRNRAEAARVREVVAEREWAETERMLERDSVWARILRRLGIWR